MVGKKILGKSFHKWNKACDKRVARLISYIHFTSGYRQYCQVEDTLRQRHPHQRQGESCAFWEATHLFQKHRSRIYLT